METIHIRLEFDTAQAIESAQAAIAAMRELRDVMGEVGTAIDRIGVAAGEGLRPVTALGTAIGNAGGNAGRAETEVGGMAGAVVTLNTQINATQNNLVVFAENEERAARGAGHAWDQVLGWIGAFAGFQTVFQIIDEYLERMQKVMDAQEKLLGMKLGDDADNVLTVMRNLGLNGESGEIQSRNMITQVTQAAPVSRAGAASSIAVANSAGFDPRTAAGMAYTEEMAKAWTEMQLDQDTATQMARMAQAAGVKDAEGLKKFMAQTRAIFGVSLSTNMSDFMRGSVGGAGEEIADGADPIEAQAIYSALLASRRGERFAGASERAIYNMAKSDVKKTEEYFAGFASQHGVTSPAKGQTSVDAYEQMSVQDRIDKVLIPAFLEAQKTAEGKAKFQEATHPEQAAALAALAGSQGQYQKALAAAGGASASDTDEANRKFEETRIAQDTRRMAEEDAKNVISDPGQEYAAELLKSADARRLRNAAQGKYVLDDKSSLVDRVKNLAMNDDRQLADAAYDQLSEEIGRTYQKYVTDGDPGDRAEAEQILALQAQMDRDLMAGAGATARSKSFEVNNIAQGFGTIRRALQQSAGRREDALHAPLPAGTSAPVFGQQRYASPVSGSANDYAASLLGQMNAAAHELHAFDPRSEGDVRELIDRVHRASVIAEPDSQMRELQRIEQAFLNIEANVSVPVPAGSTPAAGGVRPSPATQPTTHAAPSGPVSSAGDTHYHQITNHFSSYGTTIYGASEMEDPPGALEQVGFFT